MLNPTFKVDNITDNDARRHQLRILKRNKQFSPEEILEQPKAYNIRIVYKDRCIPTTYRIGSKDGRGRSGVIFFSAQGFKDLGINSGDTLRFLVQTKDSKYKMCK